MFFSPRAIVDEYCNAQEREKEAMTIREQKKNKHQIQLVSSPSSPTNKETKIRAVALDLDGTLLHSTNHKMSVASVAYLRKLDGKNINILIATGRPLTSVMKHVRVLQLSKPVPVVYMNGACGVLCRAHSNGKVTVEEQVFSTPVPLDTVPLIIQFASKHKHAIQYYYEDTVYTNAWLPHHYELCNKWTENSGCKVKYVKDNFAALLKEKKLPSKLLLLCPQEEMDATYNDFQSTFNSKQLSLVGGKSRKWFLEILAPGVDKGSGLEKMCFVLSLSTEECIAFGDGSNDLEFLRVAGKGIAMKNGVGKAKNAADEVTLFTNNEVSSCGWVCE